MRNHSAVDGTDDVATKTYVDSSLTTAVQALDGPGLTESGGILSVVAGTGLTASADSIDMDTDVRTFPIAFHLPGAQTTGTKTPEFLCPWAGTITMMRGRASAGSSGATYRPVLNGSVAGTTAAATLTTVVATSQSVSVAVGDRVALNVVSAGTGATDLSVTMSVEVGS
jgi:hypothetical protein